MAEILFFKKIEKKKQNIKKQILNYFKQNFIKYKFLNEEKSPVFLIDDTDSVYLYTEYADVIGGVIETTIRFGDDWLTCQSYYNFVAKNMRL